ncbi:MAG: DUF4179 domain-containing protein [Cellulosilyticaceae bacterium]
MSKKVADLMEHLDEEWLVDIEINEENEEDVCLDTIKAKAMKGIGVTSLEMQKKKSIKGKKRRWLLPLVAALTLMGMSVVAISSNEQFRQFFGESFSLIEDQVQNVDISQTKDGITFAVEGAVIDEKAGMVIISAEKLDGTVFDKDATFYFTQIDMEKPGGLGWGTQSFVSESGDKLYTLIDFSGSRKLANQKLTVRSGAIGVWCDGEVTLELQDLYTQAQDAPGTQLTYTIPEFMLEAISIKDGELAITTSYKGEPNQDHIQPHMRLIDTRKDTERMYLGGTDSWDEDLGQHTMIDRYQNISEDDIPYMQVVLDYRYFDYDIKGNWEVAFNLSKNPKVIKKRPHISVKRYDSEIKIKEVSVSALGVKLEGTKNTKPMKIDKAILHMKDGSKLHLTRNSLSTVANYFYTQHMVLEPNTEETPASAHTGGGTFSSGSGSYSESMMSVSTQAAMDGEVLVARIIDLQQVESLEIEGVIITLN